MNPSLRVSPRDQLPVAVSACPPVAVQDGGPQGCLRRAERRQDGRYGPVVHGDEGEREVLDADVVVVPRLRLAQGVLQAFLGAWGKRDEPGAAQAQAGLLIATGAARVAQPRQPVAPRRTPPLLAGVGTRPR